MQRPELLQPRRQLLLQRPILAEHVLVAATTAAQWSCGSLAGGKAPAQAAACVQNPGLERRCATSLCR